MCVNNNIPLKYLRSFHLSNDIQVLPTEANSKQHKLLVPSVSKLAYFLAFITDLLDHYLKTYKDFIVIVDINEMKLVQL